MIFHSTYNKPILLVGNGVRNSGANELLYELAEKTNIPVLTSMNGVDLAQDDIHIGFIGTHGNRIANMILNECDLVISIGARLGIRQVGKYKEKFASKAHLIRCDLDEEELSRTIKEDEEKYIMNAKDFIKLLLNEDIPNYLEWKTKVLKAKDLLKNFDINYGNLVIEQISNMLPINPIVAVDVGQNQCWAAQSLHLKGHEGRILLSGGYGTMGCGLPFAIGASISRNKSIVYCISGDGGFQMNIQELETIHRENLPIKIFILNNRVLGKISETQHKNHGDRFANTALSGGYSVPNFVEIAKAYGIKAYLIENYQILSEYKYIFENNEPCLFEISLPELSILEPKIKFETSTIEPRISDEFFHKAVEILKC